MENDSCRKIFELTIAANRNSVSLRARVKYTRANNSLQFNKHIQGPLWGISIAIGVDTWEVKDLRTISVSLEITYPIQSKFVNQCVKRVRNLLTFQTKVVLHPGCVEKRVALLF